MSLSRNATGREFQRDGPATEKLLSLVCVGMQKLASRTAGGRQRLSSYRRSRKLIKPGFITVCTFKYISHELWHIGIALWFIDRFWLTFLRKGRVFALSAQTRIETSLVGIVGRGFADMEFWQRLHHTVHVLIRATSRNHLVRWSLLETISVCVSSGFKTLFK